MSDACCSGQTRQAGAFLESGVHRRYQVLAIPETVRLRNEGPGFFLHTGGGRVPLRAQVNRVWRNSTFQVSALIFLSPDFTLETLNHSSAEEVRRNEEDESSPVSLVPDTLSAQSVLATAQHNVWQSWELSGLKTRLLSSQLENRAGAVFSGEWTRQTQEFYSRLFNLPFVFDACVTLI